MSSNLQKAKLIVGLGNPGREYANTRHNTGAWCVQSLADRQGWKLKRARPTAWEAQGTILDQPVVLAVPRTYVNVSGEAVAALLHRHGLKPSDLVLVSDDLALPLGTIRLRRQGSSGGHNGVESVITSLGTQAFARLRIGIGAPPLGMDQPSFVLGRFLSDERPVIQEAVERAVEALLCLLSEGMEQAVQRYNRRPP